MYVSNSNITKFKTYESLLKNKVPSNKVQNVAYRNFSEKPVKVFCDSCNQLVIAGSKICQVKRLEEKKNSVAFKDYDDETAKRIYVDSMKDMFAPCRAFYKTVTTTFPNGKLKSIKWEKE